MHRLCCENERPADVGYQGEKNLLLYRHSFFRVSVPGILRRAFASSESDTGRVRPH